MEKLLLKSIPYVVAFISSLVLTLILVPLVRRLNIKLGMIDKPDARRINIVPIPRGGGLALIAGVLISYSVFVLVFEKVPLVAKDLSNLIFCVSKFIIYSFTFSKCVFKIYFIFI